MLFVQVEVVEGVAGEEDHHDDHEEQGEENAEAEGQHDEHDEDGETRFSFFTYCRSAVQLVSLKLTEQYMESFLKTQLTVHMLHVMFVSPLRK